MSAPWWATARARQAFARRPSIRIVQAPHCPWSQPFFAPVSPRCSRTRSSSVVRASIATRCGSPLFRSSISASMRSNATRQWTPPPPVPAPPWRKLGGPVASPLPVARSTPWEIRLCGRVAVSTQDGLAGGALPGRQGQLLLAYLVCHRTRACPRYELEDVLWPERAPAATDSALSSLLSKLRRALGPEALAGRAEVRLALPEPLWVDVEALADAVGLAAQALEERRWEDA